MNDVAFKAEFLFQVVADLHPVAQGVVLTDNSQQAVSMRRIQQLAETLHIGQDGVADLKILKSCESRPGSELSQKPGKRNFARSCVTTLDEDRQATELRRRLQHLAESSHVDACLVEGKGLGFSQTTGFTQLLKAPIAEPILRQVQILERLVADLYELRKVKELLLRVRSENVPHRHKTAETGKEFVMKTSGQRSRGQAVVGNVEKS